jgi:hypothetical protein
VRATGNVHDTWAKQAKADWNAFLQYRAIEMQPSAQLVVIASGADAQGNSGAEGLIDLANSVLQDLVKEGTLYPDEYEQMAIPTYYRTTQEWKEPLIPGSAVEASALSLIHFEERVLPDPYFEQYQQNRDAKAFAEAYTGFFKAAFEPCLFASLLDSRTPQSRQELIDSFSQRLQSGLAQNPEKSSCCWFLQLMVLAKKSSPTN